MTPTQSIIKFNRDRNLTTFDPQAELRMLKSELKEFEDAIKANDSHEIIDALNDLRVLCTGALWKYGQEPDLSLKQTCKEILSRKGALNPITGKFEKDINQDPDTLYTANYNLSKRKTN